MADASNTLHESTEELSEQTKELHRALVSLQEELEAVDWYQQRAEACSDSALREILKHNMREEIEHASMLLEWLRRRNGDFERTLGTYLYAEGSITEVEEQVASKSELQPAEAETAARRSGESFTIGKLKG
ncbi:MAG: ferritin [Chromatiaceae bacterium]|jgi:hypothetical protein